MNSYASTTRGTNHQATKIRNQAIILKLICTGENVSRIDISRQTGLSKMSVTNIVNTLIAEGFVTDQGIVMKSDTLGRNPVLLKPDTSTYRVLGLYISRDYVYAVLTDLTCCVLYEIKRALTPAESDNTLIEKIRLLVSDMLRLKDAAGKKILGIGISCIGPLDIERGIILDPPNFHNIRSIPIKNILETEFGIPVHINNDMNASALAEKLYGKARNAANFIYVGVTNGIGAGLVLNHTLYEGAMGYGGEIGHATIHFNGPKCACGNRGCLELYAGIPGIIEQAKESLRQGTDSSLRELAQIQWKDIVDNARAGDKLSLNLIETMCHYLSIGLISLVNILDPEIIYLGHDIALAGTLVTDRLESSLKEKMLSRKYTTIPVEISAFGDKAPLTGSAAIVLEKLFNPR